MAETEPDRERYVCPVCRDTGMVQCPEQDGTGMYEQACPERVHDGQPCPACGDRGYVEGPGCNCGVGPAGYYGMHERRCGMEPCPRGCPFVGPAKPSEVPRLLLDRSGHLPLVAAALEEAV